MLAMVLVLSEFTFKLERGIKMFSRKNLKLIGIFVLLVSITFFMTACDFGNGNGDTGADPTDPSTYETEPLDDNIAQEVGYTTEVPANFYFTTDFNDIGTMADFETKNAIDILASEFLAQQWYGYELEVDFVGSPTLEEFIEQYVDEDGRVDEDSVMDDFDDEYELLEYITPILIGLSVEPIRESDWNEIKENQAFIENYIEESYDTVNEFEFKENVSGREAILADYEVEDNDITLRNREWLLFIEEQEKMISFNYMDSDDEIIENIVDVAAEKLNFDF